MKPRWVRAAFGAVFLSGSYWHPGRGYLEAEKLDIAPDSLTTLGECTSSGTAEECDPWKNTRFLTEVKIKLILYLFAGTETQLQIISVSY